MPYAGTAIKGNYCAYPNQKRIGRYFGAYPSYCYLSAASEKGVGDGNRKINYDYLIPPIMHSPAPRMSDSTTKKMPLLSKRHLPKYIKSTN